MADRAFLRLDASKIALGRGPFVSSASPPHSGAAFYINDFQLTDSEPWKIPGEWSLVGDLSDVLPPGDDSAPEVTWEEPQREVFARLFTHWSQSLLDGRMEKVVPVITERGAYDNGNPEFWVRRAAASNVPYWGYGYWDASGGFAGVTPERFLDIEGETLHVAALAGTTRSGQENVFLNDPKQVHEHELVVGALNQVLSALGDLERKPRRILKLNGLIHYLTDLRVILRNGLEINDLIDLIHPTPALGTLPRRLDWLTTLSQQRAETETPPVFGAPFGFVNDGKFSSVVAIRGMFWNATRVFLPAGCGLVKESQLENEWEELALKRSAVKAMLERA